MLETFGRHRLLSFDRDPSTREPTVEIAHEALLAGLDAAARMDRRSEGRHPDAAPARVAVAEWESAERDPSFLLRGARLDQVRAWAETTTLAISDADRVYVTESL